jgi:hypothetical protein
MYKIIAKKGNESVCIYNDIYRTPEVTAINPKLTLEEGNAGKFTIKLPQSNAGYSFIERMNTEIIIYKRDKEIWSGRMIASTEDFHKNKTLTCEGELAYLNDTTQPQEGYINMQPREILTALINIHNNKVSADKQFSVGAVTITDPEPEYYKYTDYESTLHEIKKVLIDKLQGFIRLRKVNGVRYIDYIKDEDRATSTQVIQFGSNLLDFTKNYDATDFCTVVLPLGASLDSEYQEWEALQAYTTVYSVNNHSIYVPDQNMVNAFGWIEKIVHWDDIDEPSELLTKARQYLTEVQYDNLELEVKAVDLSSLDVNIEEIHLSEKVRVISRPHELDKMFTVTSIDIPLDNPGGTTFKMASTSKQAISSSMSSKSASGNDAIVTKINNMPTESKILNEAKRNATAIIDSFTTGYITTTQNDYGSQELYISDVRIDTGYDPTNPMKNASKYWRWNLGGLAYFNKSQATPGNPSGMKLALTMDGAINADLITTGYLSANRIKTGRISAEDGRSYWDLNNSVFLNDNSLDHVESFVQIQNSTITCYYYNGSTLDKRKRDLNISESRIIFNEEWIENNRTRKNNIVLSGEGLESFYTSDSNYLKLSAIYTSGSMYEETYIQIQGKDAYNSKGYIYMSSKGSIYLRSSDDHITIEGQNGVNIYGINGNIENLCNGRFYVGAGVIQINGNSTMYISSGDEMHINTNNKGKISINSQPYDLEFWCDNIKINGNDAASGWLTFETQYIDNLCKNLVIDRNTGAVISYDNWYIYLPTSINAYSMNGILTSV